MIIHTGIGYTHDRISIMIASIVSCGIALGTIFLVDIPAGFETFADDSPDYTPTTREFYITAEDTTIEIAPDVKVEACTYNGTIPGPTLRATEGDRVIIHFTNNGKLPHFVVCVAYHFQYEMTRSLIFFGLHSKQNYITS